ncbi:MAG: hypothetical protein JWR69_1726 [Pedosphaera sp.]|nr:hypothetical protein [Pedosphaera sp.]
MTAFHQRAFRIGLIHFGVCAGLAVVVYMFAFGAALSDSYQPDPWWFTGMQYLLFLLEAPVAAVAWLSNRVAPSRHPSLLLFFGLAVVWSLVVGYLFAYARQRLNTPKGQDEQSH